MKFTLKPYQSEAVDDVLKALDRARELHHDDGVNSSVSLSATTGAGKTVMAAAVIESLFWGSDKFGTDPDPGAVVIWFSDDPSLNEQTKDRLRQASEKFTYDQLVTIKPPFARAALEPGKVYFLNTQRLSKSSLLTRGADVDDEGAFDTMNVDRCAGPPGMDDLADDRQHDQRPGSHRLPDPRRGAPRVQHPRRVREADPRPPADQRRREPGGDADRVGHLGDDRALPGGDEGGARRRRAARPAARTGRPDPRPGLRPREGRHRPRHPRRGRQLRHGARAASGRPSSRTRAPAGSATRRPKGCADVVKPLLILQAPNTPDTDQIGMALDEILRTMPELSGDSVRHVFGDHKPQKFGAWEVEWIEPQRVEASTNVRVLVAKDAISTGWDCPRAEVLVSFRPAKDQTHITQLLGRMVRNPLARRVPGRRAPQLGRLHPPVLRPHDRRQRPEVPLRRHRRAPGRRRQEDSAGRPRPWRRTRTSRTSCGRRGTSCRPRRCRRAVLAR